MWGDGCVNWPYVVIDSQDIHIANQYVIHLTFTQCFVSIVDQKAEFFFKKREDTFQYNFKEEKLNFTQFQKTLVSDIMFYF